MKKQIKCFFETWQFTPTNNPVRRDLVKVEISREALKAMNLSLFAKESHSTALTVGIAPERIGAGPIVKGLKENFGMTIAGGQDQAKGKIFRFSHIGDIEAADTIAIISAIESTLKSLGHDFKFGAGVTKATELLGK